MSLVKIGNPMVEPLCYLSMVVLSILSTVSDKVPLHLNITVFSLAIIIIGSYRSLNEIVMEMKKVYIDGKKGESIETMTSADAMKFPIFAGGMLVGLYSLIKFFGKDSVNYFILVYIAVGGTTGIKALLNSFMGDTFAKLDEGKLIDIKNNYIDLQVTPYDIICCILSCIQVGIYVYTKSWVYNNILAIVFCVHALQLIFLGNFKTGALLLTLLFFYDIFFVFGTDVMLTVAKNIDAPIKLMWPRDLIAIPPKYSILGLGDIVIPGVFVSLCLRFDFLKKLDINKLNHLVEQETKGNGE
jgi:minor histocompatibility antigen H13